MLINLILMPNLTFLSSKNKKMIMKIIIQMFRVKQVDQKKKQKKLTIRQKLIWRSFNLFIILAIITIKLTSHISDKDGNTFHKGTLASLLSDFTSS